MKKQAQRGLAHSHSGHFDPHMSSPLTSPAWPLAAQLSGLRLAWPSNVDLFILECPGEHGICMAPQGLANEIPLGLHIRSSGSLLIFPFTTNRKEIKALRERLHKVVSWNSELDLPLLACSLICEMKVMITLPALEMTCRNEINEDHGNSWEGCHGSVANDL